MGLLPYSLFYHRLACRGYRLLIFAAIICAILVFCEDVIIALEPFLLLCLCLIKCNNSYDEFIKMVWLAVPAAAAIIFHFIYYQRKLPHGELFWPMLAVSVAVTLGGLGKITAKEYFSLMPIFFYPRSRLRYAAVL